ncbi:TetR family transcriptional regulator [Halopseudomonas oceani]|jgi:TetR/AcrR family transcriptional repressor of lmrAB and yxaGH operons|uniref:TetR/AcrR family transcriptional regulator n=1 Tax=Halopseudomonas oceani TaxID=1708783 RepID=A0A2P4ESX9_9GAMM|nr:TetR/AcrR family transcriptional regulator [Halopseudomonas oceani]POB02243.1 TetR/AcrR family transcriptional regulator [Halopseudomonas oceani]GGE53648.1 TetR family transcriptional regulator [Halopseudomonas oceani]
MPAAAKHREHLIQAAAKLFRQRGYAATGLNDILRESGAPKGSLYHYFPGGKEELGEAAVRWAGEQGRKTLAQIAEATPDTCALLRAYAERLAGWMAASDFRDGCPIATTMLETVPASSAVTAAGRAVFGEWCAVLAAALQRDGLDGEGARRLAQAVIASLEGALLLARVAGNKTPIAETAEEMMALIRLRTGGH